LKQVIAWIERTNLALAPHGLEVRVRAIRVLPPGHGRITHRRHRKQLAVFSPRDGSIHVFAVRELELFSARRADRRVRGMYWRYRGWNHELMRREYVVVNQDAPDTTLVHEIGHLLGLPHHRSTQNLMCGCRNGPQPRFTVMQGEIMRRNARRFLLRSMH
jgi:hypothetical protein